ncbi:hypothetical protein LTR36_000186 [Oleoguttula mirabilis]|uniref:F-box domain-containing protein n=1 Tax=Oleoguttula mirabilis TaxID=1507867 RepID=A0AAV9JZK6_9PEZI|nr:hypothetical protein LTR36_000186 [Oleoguttula mirabilis]
MTAARRVFDTYELLENVLLHLPLRQLLLAQRISTSFRDLIWRSATINRALFFTPATAETVERYCYDLDHDHSQSQPDICDEPDEGIWMTAPGPDAVSPLLNPFLPVHNMANDAAVQQHTVANSRSPDTVEDSTIGRRWFFDCDEGIAFSDPPRRFYCDFWFADDRVKTMERSEGSFKDMLVTHPPCRKVEVMRNTYRLPSSDDEPQHLEVDGDEAGVYFGDFLVAASQVTVNRHHNSSLVFGHRGTHSAEVVGGELWQRCPKSVDEITGWEMLRMFEVGVETV